MFRRHCLGIQTVLLIAWFLNTPSSKAQDDETSKLVNRAVERLVELQESDGAWPYEGVYRVQGQIPIGYRIGGTAIVCEALLYSPASDSGDTAIKRGMELILTELEDPKMRPSTADRYDVRIWGHIYALDLFCRIKDFPRFSDLQKRSDPWIDKLVAALTEQEIESGGWNYATRQRHACFVTAPAVQALLLAKQRGANVQPELFDRTAKVLSASRTTKGAFQYSGQIGSRNAAKLPGSIARSAICETTLLLLDHGSSENLLASIDAFHQYWDELEKRRKKTGTHKPPFGVAPYYFYYGHRYLSQAILLLPEEQREQELTRFRQALLKTKDEDNTWNDRVFERSKAFGTAMSVLALQTQRIPLPQPLKSKQ